MKLVKNCTKRSNFVEEVT